VEVYICIIRFASSMFVFDVSTVIALSFFARIRYCLSWYLMKAAGRMSHSLRFNASFLSVAMWMGSASLGIMFKEA